MVKDIFMEKYSEKSFVLRGDTRTYKEDIKKLGGKYNSRLKGGPGWIFPLVKEAVVKDYIDTGVVKVQERVSTDKYNNLIIKMERILSQGGYRPVEGDMIAKLNNINNFLSNMYSVDHEEPVKAPRRRLLR